MNSKSEEGAVVSCDCSMRAYFPPRTTVEVASNRTLTLEGPKHEALLEITLEQGTRIDHLREECICVFVPVAIVANHLRQAGWTVTPPGAQLPSHGERK